VGRATHVSRSHCLDGIVHQSLRCSHSEQQPETAAGTQADVAPSTHPPLTSELLPASARLYLKTFIRSVIQILKQYSITQPEIVPVSCMPLHLCSCSWVLSRSRSTPWPAWFSDVLLFPKFWHLTNLWDDYRQTEMEGRTAYRQHMTVFWSHAQHHVTTSLMKLAVGERNVATNLGTILGCVIEYCFSIRVCTLPWKSWKYWNFVNLNSRPWEYLKTVPLPSLGYIWAVMLVWRKGNIEKKTVPVLQYYVLL